MSNDLWRWADPDGQQRRVRLDELRAALAGGVIAPNTPVWRAGWKAWQPAHEVPELTTSALSAANGVVPNIPPPPLAVVAVQHEFEAKATGSFRPPPVAPVGGDDEPPPPPKFVPLAVRGPSLPPAAPSAPGSSPAAHAAPAAQLPPSLPTAIGLPPPPELAAMVAQTKAGAASANGAKSHAASFVSAETALAPAVPSAPTPGAPPPTRSADPMIEELSGSMLLDDASAPAPRRFGDGSLPAPTDPVVHGSSDDASLDESIAGLPSRRPQLTALFDDLRAMRAGKPPKNKLLVGVAGVLALSVVIMVLALIVSAFSGSSSETKSASSASASASGAAPASTNENTTASGTTATAAATPNAVPPPATREEPKPQAGGLGDCAVAGDAHIISPRVFIPSAVEASSIVHGAVALGFATNARDSVALTLDPTSLAITGSVKARAVGGDVRRVSPVVVGGKLAVVPEVDKKDKLAGRRVVATSPPIDIGVAEGSIVWAPHGQNSYAKLFTLEGEGAVDALRAVPLTSAKGIALTFRRGNAVYVGVARGDAALTPEGPLHHIGGLGPQVGSPSIHLSGDTVLVAWADRAGAQDPWLVRWSRLPAGGTPDAPKELALPDGGLGGQAMSPAVAGLGGGRFLVAWTEGPVSNHQVRAANVNADGSTSGPALSISAPGLNAGQPQIAIGADGRGAVAFLAKGKSAYEIHATPLACPAK